MDVCGISVTLIVLVTGVAGNHRRVTNSACKDLLPNHGVEPQKGRPPFKITPDAYLNCYITGEPITVTITVSKPHYFKGILIKSRKAQNPVAQPGVGKFHLERIDDDKPLQLRCNGAAVTHTKKGFEDKKRSLKLLWLAPKVGTGPVVFQATLVKEESVFWTEVLSQPLKECGCIDKVSAENPIEIEINAERLRKVRRCPSLRGILRGFCSPDALGKTYCCKYCKNRCVDSLTWKTKEVKCVDARCSCAAIKEWQDSMQQCCRKNVEGRGADNKRYKCREMCCKSCKELGFAP